MRSNGNLDGARLEVRRCGRTTDPDPSTRSFRRVIQQLDQGGHRCCRVWTNLADGLRSQSAYAFVTVLQRGDECRQRTLNISFLVANDQTNYLLPRRETVRVREKSSGSFYQLALKPPAQ
jgi:hypothetical protein